MPLNIAVICKCKIETSDGLWIIIQSSDVLWCKIQTTGFWKTLKDRQHKQQWNEAAGDKVLRRDNKSVSLFTYLSLCLSVCLSGFVMSVSDLCSCSLGDQYFAVAGPRLVQQFTSPHTLCFRKTGPRKQIGITSLK